MAHVPHRQQLSLADWLEGLANENAVHNHFGTDRQVSRRKFVLGRNFRSQSVFSSGKFDGFAGIQVGQGNQDIIFRIELQDFLHLDLKIQFNH